MALIITSSKTIYRVGEPDPPTFSVAGATGPVHWSCNHGACIPDDVTEGVILSPANRSYYMAVGDPAVVTVHDTVADVSASVSIDIFATLPFTPDYGYEPEFGENTEISPAEDGTETIFEDVPFAVFPLRFLDREADEAKAAIEFWGFHRMTRRFYVVDITLGQIVFGRFDSTIKAKANWNDGVDYSFQIRCPKWSIPAVELSLSDILPLYSQQ